MIKEGKEFDSAIADEAFGEGGKGETADTGADAEIEFLELAFGEVGRDLGDEVEKEVALGVFGLLAELTFRLLPAPEPMLILRFLLLLLLVVDGLELETVMIGVVEVEVDEAATAAEAADDNSKGRPLVLRSNGKLEGE
jgi:hypothetical protein